MSKHKGQKIIWNWFLVISRFSLPSRWIEMAQTMAKLTGKVALITGKNSIGQFNFWNLIPRLYIAGASSGIGAATAVLFSKLGATLALSGRNMDNLQKTANACSLDNGQKKPLLVQGNLSQSIFWALPVLIIFPCFAAELCKEEDTARIMGTTISEFGRLDILVNNAGILEMGTIENTSLEQYDRVMNTNVRWERFFDGYQNSEKSRFDKY